MMLQRILFFLIYFFKNLMILYDGKSKLRFLFICFFRDILHVPPPFHCPYFEMQLQNIGGGGQNLAAKLETRPTAASTYVLYILCMRRHHPKYTVCIG